MTVREQFENETKRFERWANREYPNLPRHGEWECEYWEWQALYSSCRAHLDTYTPQEWTEDDSDMLLYVLARDNEVQLIQSELENRPEHLAALAKLALSIPCDRDARWQLADSLGKVAIAGRESLLEQYFGDGDEYVRRRALLSLGRIGSSKVDVLAVRAWDSGDEYHRMCALSALSDVGSRNLGHYLDMAETDGRQFLVSHARRIRAGSAR